MSPEKLDTLRAQLRTIARELGLGKNNFDDDSEIYELIEKAERSWSTAWPTPRTVGDPFTSVKCGAARCANSISA